MKKYFFIFAAAALLLGGCSSKTESLFKKAVRLNAKGNITEALKTYNIILKNDPNYFPALVNRAVIHEQTGAFKSAEADYERAYNLNPRYPELLNNMGAYYVSRGRPLMGIYYLNQAIDANPVYFVGYLNRAAAYNALEKMDDALRDLNTALALNPASKAAVEERGLINLKNLYNLEAIDDFSEALSLDPYDAKNYYRRGVAFRQAGHYANAMLDFDTAIKLNPDYADALYARALLHFKNVDHYSAMGDLNRIKTINNKYAKAYELSGDIYAIEDPVPAVANYLAAEKLDPANSRRYRAKINLMRTEEGRKRVITRTFWE